MVKAKAKSAVLEIARLAGVSRASAYATLNPGSSGNIGVAEATRKKILKAAAKVGYVKNELATSLSTGRTNTIGVCVQSLRNHFFCGFSSVLDSLAYADGYSVLLSSAEYDRDTELRNIKSFLSKKVDALAIAYVSPESLSSMLPQIKDGGAELVSIGDFRFTGIPSVYFDEIAAAKLQALHLWQTGRRKVLHLNAGNSPDLAVRISSQRFINFAAAWRSLSGEMPEEIKVSNGFYPDPGAVETVAKMAKAGKLDAVACAADTLALGLASSLSSAGVRVPDDIAIIGMDDLDCSSDFFVPLTTIRLPTDKLAQGLWNILKRRLSGEGFNEGVAIQPELVKRKSA